MIINDFVLNTVCIPLYSFKSACQKADDVFNAYLKYVGYKIPIFLSDTVLDYVYIAEEADNKFSIYDWLDKKIDDREFYSAIQDVFDRCRIINEKDFDYLHDIKIKLGDDTRFDENLGLKYAFHNSNILISITDSKFWQRHILKDKRNGDVFNLYSEDISFLPFEIPPFSLSNTKRFVKTSKHNKDSVIYQEIETGNYWYEDKYHHDTKPHFEVFDNTCTHLGEADMTGFLDSAKADKNKKLKL